MELKKHLKQVLVSLASSSWLWWCLIELTHSILCRGTTGTFEPLDALYWSGASFCCVQ